MEQEENSNVALEEDNYRKYTDIICFTKSPNFLKPVTYFKSTFDFSAVKRYKTVVQLEPTLAPIRYYRSINYGIPQEWRYRSSVDCDFRPRPKSFSETTWIFPKHGRESFKSTFEENLRVDTKWYISKVSMIANNKSKATEDPQQESCYYKVVKRDEDIINGY